MSALWLVAGLLAAVGLWMIPVPAWRLYRIQPPPIARREARWLGVDRRREDPFANAAGYDLFAVCLRSGMPVAAAAEIAAQPNYWASAPIPHTRGKCLPTRRRRRFR